MVKHIVWRVDPQCPPLPDLDRHLQRACGVSRIRVHIGETDAARAAGINFSTLVWRLLRFVLPTMESSSPAMTAAEIL